MSNAKINHYANLVAKFYLDELKSRDRTVEGNYLDYQERRTDSPIFEDVISREFSLKDREEMTNVAVKLINDALESPDFLSGYVDPYHGGKGIHVLETIKPSK